MAPVFIDIFLFYIVHADPTLGGLAPSSTANLLGLCNGDFGTLVVIAYNLVRSTGRLSDVQTGSSNSLYNAGGTAGRTALYRNG